VRSLRWKYIYVERPKRDVATLRKTIRHLMERRMLLKLLRYPKHFLRGYFQGTNEYLFDLESDPKEKNNLVSKRPEIVAQYRQLLTRWQQDNHETAEILGGIRLEYKEDELMRKHLEDLGYM